jgi:hypothetical protein
MQTDYVVFDVREDNILVLMGSHDRNVCLGCRVSGRDRFDIK